MPRVAHRQGLPYVPVGFVPVHDATPVLRVDLHVDGTVWGTSIRDAAGPDAFHDAVELGVAHAKAIVLDGEGAIRLVEVEREALVHIDGAERADARLRPRDVEETGEQFRRSPSVSRWNDGVVEFDAHRGRRGRRLIVYSETTAPGSGPQPGSARTQPRSSYYLGQTPKHVPHRRLARGPARDRLVAYDHGAYGTERLAQGGEPLPP